MRLINRHLSKVRALKMSDNDVEEKERRKREYNRLAQRDFRRRRKEHLKNLEQMQREQSSEQPGEIEQLRAENDDLRRENETLRGQLYGASSSSGVPQPRRPLPSSSHHSERSYSTSPPETTHYESTFPSVSGQMITEATQAVQMPHLGMSLNPSQSLPVLQVSPRRSPVVAAQQGPPAHLSGSYPAITQSIEPNPMVDLPGYDPHLMIMSTVDKAKAKRYLRELFRPLLSNPSVLSAPMDHLATLSTLRESLPTALKPTESQLESPHYYAIDMVPSPALRDRLINFDDAVARGFVDEVLPALIGDHPATSDYGQLVIWGEDVLNESSWEFSQDTLHRWGWLLGRDWVQRANFWRRQREAPLLPEW